jgi:hypothetical protein
MQPPKSEKQVLQISERLETLANNVEQLIAVQKSQGLQIQQLLDSRSAGADATSRREIEDSRRDKADGDEKGAQEFAMPPKHTTAVHHLFNWTLIKKLIPPKQSQTYVNDLELNRGLLRLYGCGEGEDKGDGHEGAPSPAGSQDSVYDDDTSSGSPHGVWGNGQLPQPPTSSENNARDHPGGLSPRGGLMLDSSAVDSYFRSYMDNIHILHPFMETKVLRQMIHNFKRKYSWDYRNHATNAVTGNKRKREATESPTPNEDLSASFSGAPPVKSHGRPVNVTTIEHSVANAIILLIMALGKVCAHREPLPGPVSTSTLKTSTPHTMYSTLSDLPYIKSAPASPYNHTNGIANGITAASPSAAQGKNMDVIPGLSYFAKAADILGELPGGVHVSHIQAYLMAGLYMGQLARVVPAHYYIGLACRGCQILIESTKYTTGAMKPGEKNLVDFAFWSALQLESDILAEIELPPSGITRYEATQHAMLPTSITLDAIPEWSGTPDIHRFYSYQIQLRRTMNDIHTMLYKKSGPERKLNSLLHLVGILEEGLESWRQILNDWQWDEDDYQSEDINVARMRAKYYGARYIIHRPLLQMALDMTTPLPPRIKQDASPENSDWTAMPSPGQKLPPHDMKPPAPRGGDPNRKLDQRHLHGAAECVKAALRSTTVFDKVPKRLIITNIFGTAHA